MASLPILLLSTVPLSVVNVARFIGAMNLTLVDSGQTDTIG
jgi:hypothetical protein